MVEDMEIYACIHCGAEYTMDDMKIGIATVKDESSQYHGKEIVLCEECQNQLELFRCPYCGHLDGSGDGCFVKSGYLIPALDSREATAEEAKNKECEWLCREALEREKG
jgi:DNA-directed RNA polymerase subunit RPC12/RpoP